MYTRRNSIESSAQHWCILLAAVVTTWMAWGPSGIEINAAGAVVAIGLLALNALVVTLLATRAVRKGQSLVETMMWESVTTYASLGVGCRTHRSDRGPCGSHTVRDVPLGAVPRHVS